LLGQDTWHRTAGIGKPGRNSQDWTARTRQPEKTVGTVGTVHPGQETEDKTARKEKQKERQRERIRRLNLQRGILEDER
jgi:hypothetical protein